MEKGRGDLIRAVVFALVVIAGLAFLYVLVMADWN